MTAIRTPVLETIGISKAFPGVKALEKVDLKLYPGSVTALVGENGAGKSTLVKILTGVYTPDEGRILLGGRRSPFRTPRPPSTAASPRRIRKRCCSTI